MQPLSADWHITILVVLFSCYKYSSPFKGEARRGMECYDAEKPISTPPLPLKRRELLMAVED